MVLDRNKKQPLTKPEGKRTYLGTTPRGPGKEGIISPFPGKNTPSQKKLLMSNSHLRLFLQQRMAQSHGVIGIAFKDCITLHAQGNG